MRRALLACAVLLLTACPGEGTQRAPAAAADGLQLTGRLAGHRVSVSDGEPEVTYGDCDLADGDDTDLCIESHTIDGAPIGLIIENPAALEVGVALEPVSSRANACALGCDDLHGGVVVRLRVGDGLAQATVGRLRATKVGERFAASFELEFGDDTVSGSFDVRPPVTP